MKKEFYRKKKQIDSLTAVADSLENALKLIDRLYICLDKVEAAKEKLQQIHMKQGGNDNE